MLDVNGTYFGKIWDSMLVQRNGMALGKALLGDVPLTLVSEVGNAITFEDSSGQKWTNFYVIPLGNQPEWVTFVKVEE